MEDTATVKVSDRSKRWLMMLADAIALPVALWAAVALRYGDIYKDMTAFWWQFPLVAILGVAAFRRFNLYRAIVRYIGPSSMLPVIHGVTIAALGASLSAYITGAATFPRSVPIIFWFVAILFIGGGRVVVRAYFYGLFKNYLVRENVAIYGAGDSAAQLAIALLNGNEYMPVALIADTHGMKKNTIHGIRVIDVANLDELIESYAVKRVLIATPNQEPAERRKLLNRLAELPVLINTIPDINALVSDSNAVPDIREIDISDLLGRDRVPPDETLMSAALSGRKILVTGAAGTIGSEICRKILARKPACLVLYDNSEFGLYQLQEELRPLLSDDTELVVMLGSILNPGHLKRVLESFAVETVYHAAAYKHVPLVEQNIIEGVRNNVVGTWMVANAIAETQVNELVMVSSDKAVRPTNVMGASKRMAELIVQGFAEQSRADSSNKTFCMVRFGNVLKSSGSVVPRFEHQIRSGGPVTVTHPETSRYFMTCGEASELVIQAGEMAGGGEIFVLDMGEPVFIKDLAAKMIHLHGKLAGPVEKPTDEHEVIDISYIGLRPGEKLTEELIIGEDVAGTHHPKIMQAREAGISWETLSDMAARLALACQEADYEVVRALLEQHVSGYKLVDATVDPGYAITRKRDNQSNVTRLDNRPA